MGSSTRLPELATRSRLPPGPRDGAVLLQVAAGVGHSLTFRVVLEGVGVGEKGSGLWEPISWV